MRKEFVLEKRFASAFKNCGQPASGVVLGPNIDRMVTLFKACLRSNRQLVVDPYTAVVLDEVAKRSPNIPNVLGFNG